MIFLVMYAFGCELWAPWSEELGRKPILQLSLFLVNIWQLPVALAPNFASIMVGRALGGLSSAGGSVTLGMIADMWDSEKAVCRCLRRLLLRRWLSAWPRRRWLCGGEPQLAMDDLDQLIFGGAVSCFTSSCTRNTIHDHDGPHRQEVAQVRQESEHLWSERAAQLQGTFLGQGDPRDLDPTVPHVPDGAHCAYAFAAVWLQRRADLHLPAVVSLVYKQWNFSTVAIGLAFLPLLVGYFIAWGIYVVAIGHQKKVRAARPGDEHAQFESRLWWLLFTAPLLPIGLIGFAWTSVGPPVHWMGTMVFAALIGIANASIYGSTVDYMIAAYGPYSASATGGNGWSRDFLAGVLTVPATPFYTNIGRSKGRNLEYASTILFCIATVLVVAVYVIYWKGPVLRKRSPFAQQLNAERKGATNEGGQEAHTTHKRPVTGLGSRRSSYHTSQHARRARLSQRFAQCVEEPLPQRLAVQFVLQR